MPITAADFRKTPVLPVVTLVGITGKLVFPRRDFPNGGHGWFPEMSLKDLECPDPTSIEVIREALEDQGWAGEPDEALSAVYLKWQPSLYQGSKKPKGNAIFAPNLRDDDGKIDKWDQDSKSFVKVGGKDAQEQEESNLDNFRKKFVSLYKQVTWAQLREITSSDDLEVINSSDPEEIVKFFEEEVFCDTADVQVQFQVTTRTSEDGRKFNGVGMLSNV